jgi:SAM-dependent methyltransferase
VTVARYGDVADFYTSGWRDVYDDAVSFALFDLLEPVNDLSVLDLACGHGRISREIARRGGRVVGVDLSEKLIDQARAIDANEPLGISYIKADAASPSILPGQAFGAVVSSFGLSDIDDLDGALATVARVLLPMGRFVFSILHPCFAGGKGVSGSWPATGSYYDEGWVDGQWCALQSPQAGGRQPPHAFDVRQHAELPRFWDRYDRRTKAAEQVGCSARGCRQAAGISRGTGRTTVSPRNDPRGTDRPRPTAL